MLSVVSDKDRNRREKYECENGFIMVFYTECNIVGVILWKGFVYMIGDYDVCAGLWLFLLLLFFIKFCWRVAFCIFLQWISMSMNIQCVCVGVCVSVFVCVFVYFH